jgi:hypothetical protein
VPTEHLWPVAQPLQLLPPQSTSVSPWLTTPSEQLGWAQLCWSQIRLWQSADDPQDDPAVHRAQLPPPQSTSVSMPFVI